MKEYLGLLFSVCLVAAIVRAISPQNSIKKHLELLCSLCVICVIVSPVMGEEGIFQDVKNMLDTDADENKTEYEQMYSSYLIDGQISFAEQALEAELAEIFGKSVDAFEVVLQAETDIDSIAVSKTSVIIGASAIEADPQKIKEYIAERTNSECEIIYKFNNEKY